MLANNKHSNAGSGSLSKDVQLPATSLNELLGFISDELPHWRDRIKDTDAETKLTSRLCAHLNSASRHSSWDFLQFRQEEPDEVMKGRTVDLIAAPSDVTVWIEGRSYIDFDTLLPIECKRLPTPKDNKRDEREYVIEGQGTTGGMQRFKAGLHGAKHTMGAMIGYVQKETRAFWNAQISKWIEDLATAKAAGWTVNDRLDLIHEDEGVKMTILRSSHERDNGLPQIELRHLWISMN
jgi:hypothetical protein